MSEKLSITFDEENNIRVLDPEKFRESDHLKGLSMEFITKVISMDETMSSLTECLDDFAVQIEKEKLRALGERNKWESETENRKRKMMELNNLLNEKKAELERYTVEYDSLIKVEAEQKALINKLSSN